MKRKIISIITSSILMFSAVSASAAKTDNEGLYVEKEIYNLGFAGADTVNTVTASSTDDEKAILMTWQPAGLADSNIFTGFANGNAAHTYGVVIEESVKPDDEILKLEATSSATNAYTTIIKFIVHFKIHKKKGDQG